MGRMVVRHGTLAGDGFSKRNTARFGEFRKSGFGTGVTHAAAGNDQRTLGRLEKTHRLFETRSIRPGARNRMDRGFEEGLWIIPRELLHVLGEGDESRPAVGRIKQNRDRLG